MSHTTLLPPGFVSVEFSGPGFFADGTRIDLSPGFNTFLGENGTGKSTLVECVRYAIDPSVQPSPLVKANLADGASVRVVYRDELGSTYTVERRLGEPARIADAAGHRIAAPIEQLVRAEFYRASAAEDIGDSCAAQLALVDRFAGDDLRPVERELDATFRELRANAQRLKEIAQEIEGLQADADEANGIEAKLKGLQPADGPDAAAVSRATKAHGLRARELASFKTARERLGTVRAYAVKANADAKRQLSAIVDAEVLGGPNQEPVRKLSTTLATAGAAFETAMADIALALDNAETALGRDEKALLGLHEKQAESDGPLFARATAHKSFVTTQTTLRNRLAQLVSKRDDMKARLEEKDALETHRRALVLRLAKARDERFAIRKRVADALTVDLQPSIRVAVSQAEDSTAYRKLLEKALENRDGSRRHVGPVCAKLAKTMEPAELVKLVKGERRASRLATELQIDEERAEVMINRLLDSGLVHELELVEVSDVANVRLLVDGDYKNVADVSPGQRSSAILPLVLLHGTTPIFLDQPEDHLYARFKSTRMADVLRTVKKRRQVVFMTHDPNLVILPVADRVVELGTTAKRGGVLSSRSMAGARRIIQEKLDGGQDAFDTRKAFYDEKSREETDGDR